MIGNNTPKKQIVFLILPTVQMLDLAGPVQAFDEAIEHGAGYQLRYVAPAEAITSSQKLTMSELDNICDVELLGKNLSQDELKMNISESYYGERIVEKEEAENLLKKCSSINMVGKETISLSVGLGIGSHQGVKEIGGIPFLIVFKV